MYRLLLLATSAATVVLAEAAFGGHLERDALNGDDTGGASSPVCAGSVVYTGTVPPTVYLTTTIPYTVTVTANATSAIPTTPDLITPLPACSSTVLPFESDSISAPSLFTTSTNAGGQNPNFLTNSDGPNVQGSTIYSSAPYTSTVLVTKKTPVPVTVSMSDTAPVFFPSQAPVSTTEPAIASSPPLATSSPTPPPVASVTPANSPAKSVVDATPSGSNSPAIASVTPANSPAKSVADTPSSSSDSPAIASATPASPAIQSVADAPSSASNSPVIASATPASPPVQSVGKPQVISSASPGLPTTEAQPGTVPTTNQLVSSSPVGSIAPPTNSIPSTSSAQAIPTTATIDKLPITILSTGVVIGSLTLALPSNSATTIQVSGHTYTIGPSAIIGPSTTFDIQRPSIPASSPLPTINGASVAYISGTTYLVNTGSTTDRVTIGSKVITIAPSGVAVWTGGFAALTTAAQPSVITADGLTFTIAASYAVISGTTYSIGSGSMPKTIVVGSETLSLGPGGVGDGTATYRATETATSSDAAGFQASSTPTTTNSSLTSDADLQVVPLRWTLWILTMFVLSIIL